MRFRVGRLDSSAVYRPASGDGAGTPGLLTPLRERAVKASPYIDANHLPFTEDELFRALALTGDEKEAREAAREMAELLSDGTYGGAWSISDEVFAALTLLSDDLRERVDAYMRARWEGMRPSLVHAALGQEGLPPGSEPTPSVIRAADEELASYVASWERGCAALAEWVRRREAGERAGEEPPPWPGRDEG